jgi:hypothetical protein
VLDLHCRAGTYLTLSSNPGDGRVCSIQQQMNALADSELRWEGLCWTCIAGQAHTPHRQQQQQQPAQRASVLDLNRTAGTFRTPSAAAAAEASMEMSRASLRWLWDLWCCGAAHAACAPMLHTLKWTSTVCSF